MAEYGKQTITVDASWLPSPDGKPPAADRQQAYLYRQVRDRDLPGYSAKNPFLLAAAYRGTVYTAVSAIWDWLSGCTFVVEQRREGRTIGKGHRVRKANLGNEGEDEEYHPVDPSHPLKQLLKKPNRTETPRTLLSQMVIQAKTSGRWHLWTPPNEEGRPCGLWTLPSALLQPMLGGMSPSYPFGGWRLNPNYYGGMWSSAGIPAISNVPLDAREVLTYREPGAFMQPGGYGAVEAMAAEVDVHNAVVTSRAASMARGVNPSLMLTAKGATQDQMDDVVTRMNRDYGGADNHGKIFGLGSAEDVEATLLGQSPKDMDYPAGFEQSARALIAGLGVPPIVLNLFDDGNYAQFWAAVQAWCDGRLEPFVARISEFLTLHLAERYGEDIRIRIKLPKINDREAEEGKFQFDVGAGLLTMNQALALRDREPVDGGDVPVPAYMQQFAQPAAEGQPGAGEDMSSHPLNALGDSILESLGVPQGAGHPGSDPFGDDDDDTDSDTDVDPAARKALGTYDEAKHKRDHGQYSSTGGAGANPVRPSAGQRGSAPTRAALSPAAARHPAVVQALRQLTSKAAEIGQRVNAAMLQAHLTPADLVGTQSEWERYFLSRNHDAIMDATGLDAQTAAAVAGHLIAHAIQAAKRYWSGGGEPEQPDRPGVARPQQTADTGGQVSRPDNPHGAGSLPNRVKAFAGIPELDAFLETLV